MGLKLNALKPGDLDGFAGKDAKDFCDTGLTSADHNHCAHFACHALDLKIGRPLCGDMKWDTRHKGVTMRVNDVFNYCTVRGRLGEDGRIPDVVAGKAAFFVVATRSDNVFTKGGEITIHDHPKKHIGIHVCGEVWNFSNGQHMVVRDSLDAFRAKMRRAYGDDTSFLYAYRQDI